MAMQMRADIDASTPVMTGLTWQEFLDLPDRYRHAYLVNGELFVHAPTAQHQRIVTRLLTALSIWTDGAAGRGEATIEPPVQIRYDRGYLPDLAWFREDKCAPPGHDAASDGPPDLIVEVLSPSTRRLDTIRTRNDYPTIGVTELWFIDPHPVSALIVRPHDDGEQLVDVGADDDLRSPMLDGFSVRLGDLFRR